MKNKKKGVCVYCGTLGPVTYDHIPPKCFFSKPRPSNLITVPCCEKCNNSASKDDEYFRTVITMKDDVHEHPDAKKNWEDVLRSLERPQNRKFSKGFLSTIKMVNVFSKSGIYIGNCPSFDVELERLSRVVNRITKGLFYFETGNILPPYYDVQSYALDGLKKIDDEMMKNIIIPIMQSTPKIIGNKVLEYQYIVLEDQPFYSGWLFIFYKRVIFLSFTVDLTQKKN